MITLLLLIYDDNSDNYSKTMSREDIMSHKLDQMHLMRLFVAIVQRGSFSAAAEQLGIAATKASKDIRFLESSMQVLLLNRTTRSIYLTDSGAEFYKKSLDIIELHQQMLDSIHSMKDTLSGELRISAPSLWGKVVLTPLIFKFKQRYSGVNFVASYSNEPCDLIRDNIHIAFRSTQLKDEPYLAKFITADDYVLCASYQYLVEAQPFNTPADLAGAQMITLAHKSSQFEKVIFCHEGSEIVEHLVGGLSFSSKDAIYSAVQEGFGIAVLPRYLVQKELTNGLLQEVLSDYPVKSSKFYALYTQRRKESALVNEFIDFVVQEVGGE